MSLAQEDISVSKKDTGDAVANLSSNRVVFAHEAIGGETSIDLSNLNTPAIYTSNGFPNASGSEIAAARIYFFKKRLTLVSNLNGILVQYDSFVVTSGTGIQLIGSYLPTGLDAGEVIVGYIDQHEHMVLSDNKLIRQTYIVLPGQTTVNLGMSYKVGVGLDTGSQIGALRVTRQGKTIYRTIGNVPGADGNYTEVNADGGNGTEIILETAPAIPEIIDVELGTVVPSGDLEIFSAMETLSGTVTKIAEDAALEFYGEADPSRYTASTPSEVERRGFGDKVSILEEKQKLYNTPQTLSEYTKTKFQTKQFIGAISFNNLVVGRVYRISGMQSFPLTGTGVPSDVSITITGAYIKTTQHLISIGSATEVCSFTTTVSEVFTSLTTTLSIGLTTTNLNVSSTNSLTLEELPNHLQTTQWT